MTDRKSERRGLGRGLSALMADVGEVAPEETRRSERSVPIDRIVPNPNQPRRTFPAESLEELAASIREKGIIQPLILRHMSDDADRFEIVAGERRWRAAQMAQLHEVPALVRDLSDTEVLEVAIIENIQRADLNAIDEAAGYRQLMDRFGHTQQDMAQALGKSRSHIANLLRLMTLPAEVQALVSDGSLSSGHARALVTAEDPVRLAKMVVARGLSVRETEKLASTRGGRSGETREAARKDADTRALESDLAASLGMKVTIAHAGRGRGRLTIAYKSLDQLDRLCQMLGEP